MRKKTLAIIGLVVLVLAVVVLSRSAFVVRVDQYAIVTEFGKPVRTIASPGLYFLVPFVQQRQYLDKRILEWDDVPQEMVTRDKKRIFTSTFGRWRIKDPLRFFQNVREEAEAHKALDKIVGRSVRDVAGQHILDELVRDTNRPLEYSSDVSVKKRKTIELPENSGRENLVHSILAKASGEMDAEFGIELIDVQIKQLNYTELAQREIVNEMIKEREVVIARFEAEGREESERIRGEIKEEIMKLQGDARREALRIEGEGRAKAIAIKSAAYGEAPELFQLMETLRLYEESVNAQTTLVLSTDSPVLQLLRGPAVLDASGTVPAAKGVGREVDRP